MNTEPKSKDLLNADELHSAFFIDEHGNEIPITREMIEQASEEAAFTLFDNAEAQA